MIQHVYQQQTEIFLPTSSLTISSFHFIKELKVFLFIGVNSISNLVEMNFVFYLNLLPALPIRPFTFFLIYFTNTTKPEHCQPAIKNGLQGSSPALLIFECRKNSCTCGKTRANMFYMLCSATSRAPLKLRHLDLQCHSFLCY